MELSHQGPASEKEKKEGKKKWKVIFLPEQNVKCGFKIGDREIYVVADFKWKEKKTEKR